LIGGPNQSHKVNFKELSPSGEKVANENVTGSSVNLDPKDFLLLPNRYQQKNPSSHPLARAVAIFTRRSKLGGSNKTAKISFVNTFPEDFPEEFLQK
jgi:hypothetical protein